jgi:predicted kinase
VVLDASWNEDRCRELARSAASRTHADLVELRCEVGPEVAAERIRARVAAGGDASDATPAVATAMATRADPWPSAVTIPTGGPPSVSVAEALDALHGPAG